MIKPMGERVLLERVKKQEKTAGGIYIPEEAQKERKEGIIVSVGQMNDGRQIPLQEGDKVLYGGYSFEEIEHQGKKLVLVEFKDILAKMEGSQ